MKNLLLAVLILLFSNYAYAAIDCDGAYLMTSDGAEVDACTGDTVTENLTENGTVTQSTTGPYNGTSYSLDFDSGDYMSRTEAQGLGELDISGASSLTICAWVYPETTDVARAIVSKWTLTTGEQYLVQASATNTIAFNMSTDCSADVPLFTTATLAQNTWIHICAVYEFGVGRTIYINGRYSISDTAFTGNLCNGSADFTIGIQSNGSSNPFVGQIGQVLVSSSAATPLEVFQIYAFGIGGDQELSGYEWADDYALPESCPTCSPPVWYLVDEDKLNDQTYIGVYSTGFGWDNQFGAYPMDCPGCIPQD